jgi:hypothetical protein
MAQLYTVTMFREQRVYSYDDRGLRVNERIEKIEVKYCDLPHVTALSYKGRFPHAGVTIEVQIGSEYTPRMTPKREYYERDEEAPVAPSKAERDALVDAAIRGDLAAAISGEAA